MEFRLFLENVSNLTLYHGTNKTNLVRIFKKGLQLNKIDIGPPGANWFIEAVFLTPNINRAAWYALRNSNLQNAVIIEIQLRSTDKVAVDPLDDGTGWDEENIILNTFKALIEISSKLLKNKIPDKHLDKYKSFLSLGISIPKLEEFDTIEDYLWATFEEVGGSYKYEQTFKDAVKSLHGRKIGMLNIWNRGELEIDKKYYLKRKQLAYHKAIKPEQITALWLPAEQNPQITGETKLISAEGLPDYSRDRYFTITNQPKYILNRLKEYPLDTRQLMYDINNIENSIINTKFQGYDNSFYLKRIASIKTFASKLPEVMKNRLIDLIQEFLASIEKYKGQNSQGDKNLWVRKNV